MLTAEGSSILVGFQGRPSPCRSTAKQQWGQEGHCLHDLTLGVAAGLQKGYLQTKLLFWGLLPLNRSKKRGGLVSFQSMATCITVTIFCKCCRFCQYIITAAFFTFQRLSVPEGKT